MDKAREVAELGGERYEPHVGESRQYWRDIILGVNDGLVSMVLLVAGVVGGGLSTSQVLLTAIAGSLAGAGQRRSLPSAAGIRACRPTSKACGPVSIVTTRIRTGSSGLRPLSHPVVSSTTGAMRWSVPPVFARA